MTCKTKSRKKAKPRTAKSFISGFLCDFAKPCYSSKITCARTPEMRSFMRKTMRSGSHSIESDDLLVVSKHLFLDPSMRTVKCYKKVDGQWAKLKRKEWSQSGQMQDLMVDLIDGYQLNVQR